MKNVNLGQNGFWNIDEIPIENTIQKLKKEAGARCSDICKQKALADQNSKSHLKRCWTAWNSTFSHRFWTIFSEPKSSDRDAYDAMVKMTYFQLIRTKKRIRDRKETPEAKKKLSQMQSPGIKMKSPGIKGAFRGIQEHRKDIQKAFKAVPEA